MSSLIGMTVMMWSILPLTIPEALFFRRSVCLGNAIVGTMLESVALRYPTAYERFADDIELEEKKTAHRRRHLGVTPTRRD